MFKPQSNHVVSGSAQGMDIRITFQVSAKQAEALADQATDLPTLADVQNTLTALVIATMRVLATLEHGGTPTPEEKPKLSVLQFRKTLDDANNGGGE